MGPKIGCVKPGGDSTLQPGREQLGFPGGSDGKEPACNAGDLGLISGLGRSPEGQHDNPLQDSCLKNLHGQRRLAGYSPWGRKESDTTERLGTSTCAEPLHCTPETITALFVNQLHLNTNKSLKRQKKVPVVPGEPLHHQ